MYLEPVKEKSLLLTFIILSYKNFKCHQYTRYCRGAYLKKLFSLSVQEMIVLLYFE